MNITEKVRVRHSCSNVKTVLKFLVEGSSVPCQCFFTSPPPAGYWEFCEGSGGRSREVKVSAILFHCSFYLVCFLSLLLGHVTISFLLHTSLGFHSLHGIHVLLVTGGHCRLPLNHPRWRREPCCTRKTRNEISLSVECQQHQPAWPTSCCPPPRLPHTFITRFILFIL